MGYGCGDQGEGGVDLGLGGETGEGETDAGAGPCGAESHAGEDVGGFGGSGLAGAASADGEALEVEGDDEGLGLYVVEVDVGGVGDARGSGTVDAALFDLSEDALFEAVAEMGEVGGAVGGGVFGEPLMGELEGFAEGDDSGYVLGSRAALALVGAAVEERSEADAAADEEDSGALGGVHLVAGDAEEVYVLEVAVGGEVHCELACALHGVGVEEGSGGVGDGGERSDGLDDAGLVVGEHDGDEFGVGTDGGGEGAGIDDAPGVAGEEGDFDALLGDGLCGVEDGVVLDAGGDEVEGPGSSGARLIEDAEDGEVVALGAAGGEDDLGGAAVERFGDGLAGVVDGGTSVLALLMDGAGVAEVLDPEGPHCLEYSG